MKKNNNAALLALLSLGLGSQVFKTQATTTVTQPTIEHFTADDKATIDLTVRYFNSIDCMRSSVKGKKETEQIETQRQQMMNDIKKMQEEITTFAQNLQQQAAALSESARDKKQQDMVKMNRDYENKLKEYDEQLKLSMQQITDRLSRDVEAAVGKYAQTASIDVVVDSISGRVVYVSERAQCTNSIINIMDNKQSSVKKITS